MPERCSCGLKNPGPEHRANFPLLCAERPDTSALVPTRITGEITLSDGSKTGFSIDPPIGWQQWGNVTEKLWVTTDLLEELTQASANHLQETEDD